MHTPTACLIIIGNEILSGRTQDKNLAWLAEQLNAIGVKMLEARVIPDLEETIVTTVNECRSLFDYVFTTGGIGPTHDDITAASMAKAFGVALERNADAQDRLHAHYAPEDRNAARMKMADIPQGAVLIDNPISAAPGFQLDNVFVFAGIPSIMQAMFDGMKDRLHGGVPTLSDAVGVWLPEGVIAEGLAVIQARHPTVDIGSYPYFQAGRLGSNLVARTPDRMELTQVIDEIHALVQALGGEEIGST